MHAQPERAGRLVRCAPQLYRADFLAPPTSALASLTLYIAGLGFSAISLNGKTMHATHLATSPWTSNVRRIGFSTIDLTAAIPAQGGVRAHRAGCRRSAQGRARTGRGRKGRRSGKSSICTRCWPRGVGA
eukprot:967553-Pleurochrysis_carterae.AAC.1